MELLGKHLRGGVGECGWLGWSCWAGLCGDVGEVAGVNDLPEAEVGMKEERGAGVALAFAEIVDPHAVALTCLVHVHPETFVHVGHQSAADFHVVIQMRVHVDELPGCLVHLHGSGHVVEEIFLQIFRMEAGITA